MPIILNSLLSSNTANNTFLDKTIDDGTIGKVSLNNTDPLSGPSVSNLQLAINTLLKVIFPQSNKVNGDTLTPNAMSMDQEFRLIGTSAPIVMNALPFGSSISVVDGTRITLVGHDDSFTVGFLHNDINFGLLLNGDATLKKGYILELLYNDEIKRYIEVTRNF